MTLSPDALYSQLGRLMQSMSERLTPCHPLPDETIHWLSQAYALVQSAGDGFDTVNFKTQMQRMGSRIAIDQYEGTQEIRLILFRTMATLELKVSGSLAGKFIPVGNEFDAYTSLNKILGSAKERVLIIDPYLDASALTDFGLLVPEGVTIHLLCYKIYVDSLSAASKKWQAQYGERRPLEVRVAPPKSLHDRVIIIDSVQSWTITQSLKDLAKNSPAEIIRSEESDKLKIDAYGQIWVSGKEENLAS